VKKNMELRYRGACPLVLLAGSALTAHTQTITLYDGALNTAPGAQGWTFFDGGVSSPRSGGIQTVGGGATTYDTTVGNVTRGGYTVRGPIPCSLLPSITRPATRCRFDVQVVSEDHTSSGTADKNGDGVADRAGVSLIVIGSDQKGVELGYGPTRYGRSRHTAFYSHGRRSQF